MKQIVLHNTSFRMTIFMLHFGETLKTRFLKSCTYDCSALKKIYDSTVLRRRFVHNMLVYLCAKIGAFIKKCTIG